jgi:hypothetical protein
MVPNINIRLCSLTIGSKEIAFICCILVRGKVKQNAKRIVVPDIFRYVKI